MGWLVVVVTVAASEASSSLLAGAVVCGVMPEALAALMGLAVWTLMGGMVKLNVVRE